ncbi:MAG: alkaline phosphatase family protein [Acidobacteriota bacterium]|nr:alkaline phosphatase family protein [Acidobacteriota bacterium]
MTWNNGGRLLAIGIDAAEPTLVRKLIEQGRMPTLERLLRDGKWMKVESSARIGSGSVWPTFMSGQGPGVHGVYGEWVWHAETMDLSRYRGSNVAPFWKRLAEGGVSVGVLDVPFMPMVGLSDGFEISEWGPHDLVEYEPQIGPARVADLIAKQPPHPLSVNPSASGPHDYKNLQKLSDACLQGIKLRGALARSLLTETRPQLSLIAFTEIHHSAHYLWHTVEPEHQVYRTDQFANLNNTRHPLDDIYGEVDRQIGELMKAVSDETAVMVFSLHGMQPAHGVPAFLAPLLCEMGFARFANWNSQGWPDRSRAFVAELKSRSPKWLKKLYYRILSPTVTHRLALTTMLPLYDWNHTQAFALPTDQHGWIRINLIGREARGIVPAECYDETCNILEKALRDSTTEDGRPLVREVIRTAYRVEDALAQRIPDLVVHWDDAVFASPLRIKGSAIRTEADGKKFVGQHSDDGFCILKAPLNFGEQEILSAENMHLLITHLVTGNAA